MTTSTNDTVGGRAAKPKTVPTVLEAARAARRTAMAYSRGSSAPASFEEPMAEFISLLPVAIPRVHARIEAVAAAEGLLNLAIGIVRKTDAEGEK